MKPIKKFFFGSSAVSFAFSLLDFAVFCNQSYANFVSGLSFVGFFLMTIIFFLCGLEENRR